MVCYWWSLEDEDSVSSFHFSIWYCFQGFDEEILPTQIYNYFSEDYKYDYDNYTAFTFPSLNLSNS